MKKTGTDVFVGEYLCGGGMYDTPVEAIPDSLLSEGTAMWRSLIEDLSEWASVMSPVDPRLKIDIDGLIAKWVPMRLQNSPWSEWIAIASKCDAAILIVPETDNLLTLGVSALRSAGVHVICISNAALRMTSDKWQTAKWLHREGIPHPETWAIDPRSGLHLHSSPVASLPKSGSTRFWVKPRDGCGAMGIRCYREFDRAIASMQPHEITQQHVDGRPASLLSISCDSGRNHTMMPAVWQTIDRVPAEESDEFRRNGSPVGAMDDSLDDSVDDANKVETCRYDGGCGPVPREWQRRGESLVRRVLETLPGKSRGFLGIDWVAGIDAAHDFVIEVNPRLTTSYIGIRQMVNENLTRRLLPGAEPTLDSYSASPDLIVPAESIFWTVSRLNQSPQNRRDRRPLPPDHHRPY